MAEFVAATASVLAPGAKLTGHVEELDLGPALAAADRPAVDDTRRTNRPRSRARGPCARVGLPEGSPSGGSNGCRSAPRSSALPPGYQIQEASFNNGERLVGLFPAIPADPAGRPVLGIEQAHASTARARSMRRHCRPDPRPAPSTSSRRATPAACRRKPHAATGPTRPCRCPRASPCPRAARPPTGRRRSGRRTAPGRRLGPDGHKLPAQARSTSVDAERINQVFATQVVHAKARVAMLRSAAENPADANRIVRATARRDDPAKDIPEPVRSDQP